MAKKRSAVPKDENKRDKFKRVVEPRVNKAVKFIGLIGNCSSSGYDYKPDDVALIVTALKRALEQLTARFETQGKERASFKFD